MDLSVEVAKQKDQGWSFNPPNQSHGAALRQGQTACCSEHRVGCKYTHYCDKFNCTCELGKEQMQGYQVICHWQII